MSMYPPGVTGNEYQIAGPDWDGEEEHRCVPCDAVTTHAVASFQGSAWKTCEVCLHERNFRLACRRSAIIHAACRDCSNYD